MGDYLNDERLVSAYAAFYLLTNMPKLQAVINWLPEDWVEILKECDLVDLGSGPGTFSLAWKKLGALGDFYQIETSSLMREQARKLWEGFFSQELNQASDWRWESSNPKLLLFGHSANEMGMEKALAYIEKINPDHILFIEPGTKAFFKEMLKIRQKLLDNDYHVLFPCPEAQACPMEHSQDWCHQFIHIKHGPEVERLSQMARLDRKLLPLTVMAFSRVYKGKNPQERLVRVLPETKFSFEWEVCNNNELIRYQLMKRYLSKEESKKLSSFLAGDAILTEVIKKLEQGQRVKLLKILK